jgi:hypothetical protein
MIGTRSFAAALANLAHEREELGLELAPIEATASLASIVGSDQLDAWLEMTASIADGVDARTAAAYLISIFVWRFDEILATLYLRGVPLPQLRAEHVGVAMFVRGNAGNRDIQFRFHLPAIDAGRPFDDAAFRHSLEDVHGPLVAALHERTGLPRSALWRLVADGVSGGFLACGKRADCVDRAMDTARDMLGEPPLRNDQWAFVEIRGRQTPSEWFRLRGGCCRLYLTAGGEYCTTCVLRRRDDQVARLQRFIANGAS